MEYRCISADCHIDLGWLPHDLFISNATQAIKDRMPYVVEDVDGPKWVAKSGQNLGYANGKGGTGAVSANGYKYAPGMDERTDRIAATGLYSDGAQGRFRPTTPELRLQDQDRDGIQAEVMYGLLGAGKRITDREAAVEFYRIYNEWLAKFCSYDRRRFVGLASIPSHSVEMAVAETRRAAKLNLGGLDFSASSDMAPLWDPCWNPFWEAATEANLAVHFHGGGSAPAAPVPAHLPEAYNQVTRVVRLAPSHFGIAPVLASIIFGGVLERYRRLRIVFGEIDIGWIPYYLDRMDSKYEAGFNRLSFMKLKPSEYWRRQCRVTFQYDRIGVKLLDDIGIETLMWASDYPHPDGVFPDSQEYIKKQFGGLPGATQRMIICENAGKFYGLIPA